MKPILYSSAQGAQGATRAFPAPSLPPTPPTVPIIRSVPSHLNAPPFPGTPQAPPPTVIFQGAIESSSIRMFSKGVIRFKLKRSEPGEPSLPCVMFGKTTATLSPELLSPGKPMEIRGFTRLNTWVDKQGHTHKDLDFVVLSVRQISINQPFKHQTV